MVVLANSSSVWIGLWSPVMAANIMMSASVMVRRGLTQLSPGFRSS
jgi:hypothetical protein